ncbi:ABC transporter substrate-binding protein [Cohnella mopanensis]|uniref:ABC transporter substrate-binding protein n=1 Tax=Cohnella mopanensis TaxID=2911966 RepID=UPI001EF829F8|nr:ABC transporter substrate-binding protein [Cohnella mopanensis]
MLRKSKLGKSWTLMLATVLTLSIVLAGCGGNKNNNESSSSPTTSAKASEPSAPAESSAAASETPKASDLPEYEISLYFPGTPPKDEKEIEAKINEHIKPLINATVDIRMIDWGQYDQKMTLSVSGREAMDIIFTAAWNGHATNVAKGAYLPLNEPGGLLETYGQGIKSVVSDAILGGAQIKGKNYGVPALKEMAEEGGILYRSDIADELGLTEKIEAAKTPADLVPILEEVKAKKPQLIPLHLKDGENFNSHYFAKYDYLGDTKLEGAVMKTGTDTKVVPAMELPIYKETLAVTRELFTKKLVNQDAATSQLSPQDALKKGNVFMVVSPLKPGKDAEMAASTGLIGKLKQHGMTAITTSTGETTGSMLAISSTSKDPARAMMFINLLYTDKELNNLINFGVEGEHYIRNGEIISDGPKKADYSIGAAWMLGNQFLNYVWDTESPDKWAQFKAFNESTVNSPALGFTFDSEPVKAQVTALKNVQTEFAPGLDTGAVDPSKADAYLAKLKKNGLDQVIAEKQKQLDEFLASKK